MGRNGEEPSLAHHASRLAPVFWLVDADGVVALARAAVGGEVSGDIDIGKTKEIAATGESGADGSYRSVCGGGDFDICHLEDICH